MLAAERAGIDRGTVRAYRVAHPAFARLVREARAYFAQSMEYELVKQARGESKGSFLSTIARIKASKRSMLVKYSEPVANSRVLNLTVNQYGAPADLPTWTDDDVMDSTRAQLLRVPDAALPPDLLRLKQRALEAPIEDAEIVEPPPAEGQDTP